MQVVELKRESQVSAALEEAMNHKDDFAEVIVIGVYKGNRAPGAFVSNSSVMMLSLFAMLAQNCALLALNSGGIEDGGPKSS